MLRTLFSWLLIRCRELLKYWILLGKVGLAVRVNESKEADGEEGLRFQALAQAQLAMWHPTGLPLPVPPNNSPLALTRSKGGGRDCVPDGAIGVWPWRSRRGSFAGQSGRKRIPSQKVALEGSGKQEHLSL